MFYLQTWMLGEPLDVVLDVPDCLDHPPSLPFYIGIDESLMCTRL
jgi:hypothetical protein